MAFTLRSWEPPSTVSVRFSSFFVVPLTNTLSALRYFQRCQHWGTLSGDVSVSPLGNLIFQPVAVVSITLSQIIAEIDKHYPKKYTAPEIAITLSFVCGFIALGIGMLRLGWIVEFIPLPALSGYVTGSAITIVASQVPGLMGITGFK